MPRPHLFCGRRHVGPALPQAAVPAAAKLHWHSSSNQAQPRNRKGRQVECRPDKGQQPAALLLAKDLPIGHQNYQDAENPGRQLGSFGHVEQLSTLGTKVWTIEVLGLNYAPRTVRTRHAHTTPSLPARWLVGLHVLSEKTPYTKSISYFVLGRALCSRHTPCANHPNRPTVLIRHLSAYGACRLH
jgi:hypothetical protein